MNTQDTTKSFICHDCFRLKKCKEPQASWIFFYIALAATIAIRAVNLVMDFNPFLAKVFWYIGVGGFFVYFLYKYRSDTVLQRELERTNLSDKVLSKQALSEHDYEVVGTILCRLKSPQDALNYFFIFLSSGLALGIGIYVDFFKR